MKSEILFASTEKKSRLDYIDVCKAFGIVLVVLGHIHNIPKFLTIAIYSFHMPMFFILSGYTYNCEKSRDMPFKSYLIKKVKQYLLPYFIFCFANLLIQILWKSLFLSQPITSKYLLTNIRGIFLCYSNKANMPNCSPLWFLMCLFFANLVIWCMLKLKRNWFHISALGCVLVYYFLLPYCKDYASFPFKFPTFFIAAFFMYIGVISKKRADFFKNSIKKKTLPLIMFGLLFLFSIGTIFATRNHVGMNENEYSNFFLFVLNSIVISLAVIYMFSKASFLQNKYVLWLGKNTIYIMAFNFACQDISTEAYYYIPILGRIKMHWSVSFVFTLLTCIIFSLLCSRIKKKFNSIKKLRTTN